MGKRKTPDVVGAYEAAELLDVKDERIWIWRKEGRLPTPWATPACSPVWLRKDIMAFARNGRRSLRFTPPPTEPPVLGTAEVAELLGVHKSQVGRWRRLPTKNAPPFPEPFVVLRAGPLWLPDDINRFAQTRRKAAA